MRCSRLLAACGGLLLLGACGKDAAPQPYVYQSLARTPVGEPIQLIFQPALGDVCTLSLEIQGSMAFRSDKTNETLPLDVPVSTSYRCAEARENGDRVMHMTSVTPVDPALAGQAASPGLAQLKDVRMTMLIDRLGSMKQVETEGGDAETRRIMEQVSNQIGTRPFLVFPAGGLRMGEALDFAKSIHPGQLHAILGATGADISPEIQGEAVLVRRTEVEGHDAVEFALNLVARMRGSVGTGKQRTKMDVSMQVTGTQFVAVATGMAVGRVEMHLASRGTVQHGDESGSFTMDMDIRGTATLSRADVPPEAPEAPETRR